MFKKWRLHSSAPYSNTVLLTRKKLIWFGFALLLVLVLVATATYVYLANTRQSVALYQPDAHSPLQAQSLGASDEVDGETPDTLGFLLLGFGGPGHDGPFLTDAILLVHIDFESAVIGLISIPRDLWVTLPTGAQAKINAALTLGEDRRRLVASGAHVSKAMAETVTGLDVDYFIGIDFVGFKRVVGEELRGIEVEVSQTLSDRWYPIRGEELNPCGKTPEEIADLTARYSGFELERQFSCRYRHVYFEPGLVRMEGGDALAYARSRHGSAGGDFSRSRRQHEVLLGIRNRLMSLESARSWPELFNQLVRHTTTDLDLELVGYLRPALQKANQFEVKSIVIDTNNVLTTGRTAGGQFILKPKAGLDTWSDVHDFIAKELEN